MAKRKTKSRKKVKKKYLVEMTTLSVFLWGFCLFFLLAWIFVLGILVGRGFIPGGASAISELKGQIAKLQELVGNNRDQEARPQKKSDEDPELAFYDRLSSKKGEVKIRWQPQKTAKTPKKERAPNTIKSLSKNRLQREETWAEVEAKPQPNQDPQATSPARPKRGSSGSLQILSETATPEIRYTVQLASLGSRDKAEKMINDLVDHGYPAYYYEKLVKGKIYFRVRCGEFSSSKEAGRYATKLTKDTGIKGFVSRLE